MSRRTLLAALPPLAVAAFVVANAWAGLMPGVGFWDTGEFQTVLPLMGTAHPTGYPTYVLLGWLADVVLRPLGSPAFRITVLALLSVAAAAGTTVVLVRRLTGSVILGVAAGIGLALTPVVWANATRADPHPLHLALTAVLFTLLVGWTWRRRGGEPRADRWLVAAAFVYGLAVGNHSLSLLLAPGIGLFVLAVEPRILRRPRLVLTCAAVLAATAAAVFLELPLRAGPFRAPLVYGHPETWDGFWAIALAEQFRGSLVDPLGDLPAKAAATARFAWGQLGVLAAIVPVAFVVTAFRRPRYALLSGTAMLITLVFDASYANADIARYYLGPVLWAWTWLAVLAGEVATGIAGSGGLTATRLLAGIRQGRAVAAPLATARTAVIAVLALALLAPALADLPARRAAADRSGDRDAVAWLDQVLPALAPDAVVMSWWSTSTPLWYATLVEGRRSDVTVIDDRTVLDLDLGDAAHVIDRYLGTRPVYVIRASGGDLAELSARFRLVLLRGVRGPEVYRVTGRVGA